jgi:hypothetical protein
VTFAAGVILVAGSLWLRPIADADTAAREGSFDIALELYAVAERRFDRLSLSKKLARGVYIAVQSNQVRLLYLLQRHDAAIDKAAAVDMSHAARFWAGCALFEKGSTEQDPDVRLAWLGRAGEEFRQALELDANDWDTKYNYELTRRLVAALQKKPKTPPKQLIQLLRSPSRNQIRTMKPGG